MASISRLNKSSIKNTLHSNDDVYKAVPHGRKDLKMVTLHRESYPAYQIKYQDQFKSQQPSTHQALGNRLRIRNKMYKPDLPIPIHLNPALDTQTKAYHLKSKLLAGHYVSHSEINTVAYDDKQRKKKKEETVQRTDSVILQVPSLPKEYLYVDKGIIGIPTPHHPAPATNTFGTPTDLRVSLTGADTQETQQRYRFFVDMTGFKDEEIVFALQGRKLLIVGDRQKDENVNAKSAAEILHLPNDLQADNLRAVRDCFGTIILEEAWKF